MAYSPNGRRYVPRAAPPYNLPPPGTPGVPHVDNPGVGPRIDVNPGGGRIAGGTFPGGGNPGPIPALSPYGNMGLQRAIIAALSSGGGGSPQNLLPPISGGPNSLLPPSGGGGGGDAGIGAGPSNVNPQDIYNYWTQDRMNAVNYLLGLR